MQEELMKKIVEAKLNKATTHAQKYIQKLQQKLDDIWASEEEEKNKHR